MALLSEQARHALLQAARKAIASAFDAPRRAGGHGDEPLEPSLCVRAGAFVTLHEDGQLRGCIGTFEAREPLHRTVEEMARSAAFHDPRFPPVREDELPRLELEISVLSPMRRIREPGEVEVGRHGLYVVQGFHRGVLLPQVATDCGWDRETFLDQTCRKAGLPTNAWREGAELYVFEAEVFREEEKGSRPRVRA